ncbi:hypothetical protein EWB00_002405 [Schistosoma japonicum]|uniref:Cytochrome c oxidase assembly protein COX16 homolog, mitochondrial n=1 Tax=Schistosoma japonicum TaxID=6182 RepID=A0A4Z2DCJ2_SCHJA|nr:hypothetical protein EWB00_002405 [Schistosoma japonicum]
MSNHRVWVRVVPFIGTMVVSAYGVAYSWNYAYEKKRLATISDLDEAYVVEFHKKVSQSTGQTEWKNKRVPRPWENQDKQS